MSSGHFETYGAYNGYGGRGGRDPYSAHGAHGAHGAYGPQDDYEGPRVAIKIMVSGGFGVGKTTLLGAVSEIRPLRTEEELTEASSGIDDINGLERKSTTTVAMDFGRITLRDGVALYLFGTPGQDRFWFMWNELSRGALGAVVLADTRRLTSSFGSIDYFEQRGTPFIVAVNCFEGAPRYDEEEIREALDLDPQVPVILCDARRKDSAKQVLIRLVEHVLESPDPEDLVRA